MSDITLSKAVRSNLLSLQNTATLMDKTQNRLATGNKVNSALDNPTNFFTASALNARAGDLGALMDSMANGVQTLQAADNGLTAITKTLESMQSVLRQARQDKSFQTASYELSPNSTGTISFTGGSIGATVRHIPLINEALTPAAIGMNAATGAGTTGAAAVVSAAAVPSLFTGSGGVAGSNTNEGDIEITLGTGSPITVTIANGESLATIANNINTAAGSTIATIESGEIRLTNTAGTGITVADASGNGNGTTAAIFGGSPNIVAGSPAVTAADATAGSNTITWPGTPVTLNNDARISFTAKVNDVEQIVEISRKDALKVGNGDGTIDSADEFAAILAAKIDNVTTNADSAGVITLTSTIPGANSKVEIGEAKITGKHYDSDELVRLINSDPNLKDRIRASNDDGKLRIENQSTQILEVNGVNSSGTVVGGTTTGATISGNSVRADLTRQFNELRDALDKLSDDASFNGVNLLRGDLLTITFNETGTSSIDVQTKDSMALNSAKLEIFDLEPKELDLDSGIDELLGTLKNALAHVRTQASNFGQNLSLVENRQNFTKQMINTLQTGAANLTLADMNEEAANLLALQTRQQLSSNSLSLASQADQSVLQLLR